MLAGCLVKFDMSNNPLFNLVGKKTLITGATGGFGTELVRAFTAHGQEITATGRNSVKLDALQSLGPKTINLELTDPTAVKEFSKNCDAFDHIILAHGINGPRPMRMISPEFSLNVIQTNLLSTLDLISNLLRARKINSPGRVVFISSVSAHFGANNNTAYAASKAGGEAAMVGLARDLLHKGVTVNSIAPAAVDTPLFEGAKPDILDEKNYPLGVGKVQDISKAAIFLCLEGSKYITGESIILDGGCTWLF
jgi:NAD(P)-dependent dehydrogenase (short-subunit alcohol dehydrogenase family)